MTQNKLKAFVIELKKHNAPEMVVSAKNEIKKKIMEKLNKNAL